MKATKLKQLALKGIGTPRYFCSHCGSTVTKGDKLCPVCGREFENA